MMRYLTEDRFFRLAAIAAARPGAVTKRRGRVLVVAPAKSGRVLTLRQIIEEGPDGQTYFTYDISIGSLDDGIYNYVYASQMNEI